MRLTDADRAKVTDAVTQAELQTSGEIVTVIARRSDAYHDVAAHWGILAMLLSIALLAAFPSAIEAVHDRLFDPWADGIPASTVLTIALAVASIAFLLVRWLLSVPALRLALTPARTKARRVHARALALFRTGAEKRTTGSTGVLLYLSIAEHRAEIIADAAIHSKVPSERWGDAMAALIVAIKDGRPADGMADAVGQIGAILSQHFPRRDDDVNELPDRLIEL